LRELPLYGDTPMIVVSDDPVRGGEGKSSKLNVLDWLNKPVDFGRLAQLLATPATQEPDKRARDHRTRHENMVA
jgi:hypothetical protein